MKKIDQSQGWAKWYNISTAMLNDDTTQSLCDCHKPANGKYAPETAFENRYTKTKTKYGDVELIYLNSNVNKIRTFKEFPPLSDYASSRRHLKNVVNRAIVQLSLRSWHLRAI